MTLVQVVVVVVSSAHHDHVVHGDEGCSSAVLGAGDVVKTSRANLTWCYDLQNTVVLILYERKLFVRSIQTFKTLREQVIQGLLRKL